MIESGPCLSNQIFYTPTDDINSLLDALLYSTSCLFSESSFFLFVCANETKQIVTSLYFSSLHISFKLIL